MEISKDEQERARFRSRRMAETDRISNLLTVEARGRAEGMAAVALNMKKEGMPVDVIARLTTLSTREIENL
jgi:hypothetical protein